MATTTKSGTNPFLVVVIFLLGMVVIAVLFALVNWVSPGTLSGLFRQDQALLAKNAALSEQLNVTQTTLGETQAALAVERQKHVSTTVLIVLVVLVLALIIFYFVFYARRDMELTFDQAVSREIPRARRFHAFPETLYPSYPHVTGRTVERVKQKTGAEANNELLYIIELEFIGRNAEYVHGVLSSRDRVVTVAVASKSYLRREAWFPWQRINDVVELSHKHDLWGYSIQKTRIDEDVLDALSTAKSVKEAQEAYQEESTTGDAA